MSTIIWATSSVPGDLQAARRSYRAALQTYLEIGDLNGTALAKIGLGDVLLAQGNIGRIQENV